MKKGRLLFVVLLLLSPSVKAQDTVHRLDEVQVSGQHAPKTLRTVAPTQVVDAEQLEHQGALQLSDAVKMMAGVTLKDYGGIGGIKTVSARGLGSQFSTLTVDGVPVDDAQNGQVDLGRYLLGGAAYVSLSHGSQHGLLSARAYGAGNVIDMATAEPTFFLAERTNLKLGFETGSYDMLTVARLDDPLTWNRVLSDLFSLSGYSAMWEQKWSSKLKSSLWVNWLESTGDYPFTHYYTVGHTDSSSLERRLHSAMHMITTDANIFYTISSTSRLTAKLHYMRGAHQLPGPATHYTNVVSAESTAEEVAFAQARWQKTAERWQWQVLGKFQSLYDLYEDSASVQTLSGYLMNEYRQREGYLSTSALWNAAQWLEVNFAVDGSLSHLLSNLAQRNDVNRSTLMAVAAVRVYKGPFELKANLLATSVTDHVADLDTMPTYQRLSPYAGVMFTTGRLTLRAFYKDSYRAPNFSELYFFSMPRDLRPERARQLGAGVTGMTSALKGKADLSGTLDFYYNNVTDKIVAVPTQSMFLWSMQNVGIVHILGADVTADISLSPVTLHLSYSYQHAVDRTNPNDPDDKTYGHQIAYTPRHSGGAQLRWDNRWANLGLQAMIVGERYSRMQNSLATHLPAYCDMGFTADHKFDLRLGTLTAQLQILNLLNVQYEVVRSYPMMGRNYRLKLIYEF